MQRSRFTDNQILAILKKNEDGTSVQQLCREHRVSDTTFYNWRAKFGDGIKLRERIKKQEEKIRS